jgi:thiol-disulfide isomerase/thioredoxin
MTTPPKKHPSLLVNVLIPVVAIVALATAATLLIREKVGSDSVEHSHSDGEVHAPPTVGDIFPSFELQTLAEGKKALSSPGSRIEVINLWATWCEACMVEMPSLQKLDELLQGEGVRVLLVSVDEEYETEVPPVVKQLDLKLPIFIDAEQKLSESLDVSMIPVTYIVDSTTRRILSIESGERDWSGSAMLEKIRALLKNPS